MHSLRNGFRDRPRKSFWLLGLVWALSSCAPSSSSSSHSRRTVRINEMMARNRSVGVIDETGRPIEQDWVELYNFGNAEISLAGFGLTDDQNRPGRFRFPSGSRLGPGEFVVVYVFNRANCPLDCEQDLEDCLTAGERERIAGEHDCEDAFDGCEDAGAPDVDCDVERSVCLGVVESEAIQARANCEGDFQDCQMNCEPVGFIADFGLGSNDTIYLFDGDTLIDRLGVTDARGGDDVEKRFTRVSVGRYPDGTGPYGVHYAGATPGEPNYPIDVGAPQVQDVVLSPLAPDCEQTLIVDSNVFVDTEVLESGALDVWVEYADACGQVSEDQWTDAEVTLDEVSALDLDPEERLDLEGNRVSVSRSIVSYRWMVPGAACGVRRQVHVRVEQSGGISVTRKSQNCVTFTEAPRPAVCRTALPPVFHSAYHSDLLDNRTNHCVPTQGFGAQTWLNAIIFFDEAVSQALDPGGNQPRALIEEQTIVVEIDGEPLAPVPGNSGALPVDEPAPEGRVPVRIRDLFDFSGVGDAVIRYRIEVRDVCGHTIEAGDFSLATAGVEKPPLSVNEVNLAFPLPDDPGTPRRWIELVNRSELDPVNAGGMFITDNPRFPQKQLLAEELLIAPGGFEVIPLDDSFDLEESRGALFLIDSVDRGSCEVDAFDFDFRGLEPGTSLGRLPDGTGDTELLDLPSPGASNVSEVLFVRGDATEDGTVSLTDMVRILAILFSGETDRPACDDALDVDDSGAINVNDSVFLGNFLFKKGERIPAPYPEPGVDPTPDSLTCAPRS